MQEDDIYADCEHLKPIGSGQPARERSRFLDSYLLYNKERATFISYLPSKVGGDKTTALHQVLPSLTILCSLSKKT